VGSGGGGGRRQRLDVEAAGTVGGRCVEHRWISILLRKSRRP
jgi:hypothetical protein